MKCQIFMLYGLLAMPGVYAADFIDNAKVVSSTPIFERVNEPKQECWTETTRHERTPPPPAETSSNGNKAIGGAIVGGVLGGVLGHQVGKGSGNTAATVIGAVAGSVIGGKVAGGMDGEEPVAETKPEIREERRCRQVDKSREVIKGYDVVVRYRGQDIQTRMPYNPGDKVKVKITVLEEEPVEKRRDYDDGRHEQNGKHNSNRKYEGDGKYSRDSQYDDRYDERQNDRYGRDHDHKQQRL